MSSLDLVHQLRGKTIVYVLALQHGEAAAAPKSSGSPQPQRTESLAALASCVDSSEAVELRGSRAAHGLLGYDSDAALAAADGGC